VKINRSREGTRREILGAYMHAIVTNHDWRASESLMLRVYGRPQEKLEVSQPQSVEDVEKMSLAEIRHVRSVVEGDEPST
jgi:hypothetical protein